MTTTCRCGHDKAWHWNASLECQWGASDETCYCDRYEPKEGQGR